MKRSKLVIELKGDDSQPLFLRLATSILSEIERGRLVPGDRLPGKPAMLYCCTGIKRVDGIRPTTTTNKKA